MPEQRWIRSSLVWIVLIVAVLAMWAMFVGNELERLYRDVRCGGFHPGNDALTHELVGKSVLGILAEQPRW